MGRNLAYLLQAGYDAAAVDSDLQSVTQVRRLAGDWLQLYPRIISDGYLSKRCGFFPDSFADVVLSIAVLHFARDEAQFYAMLAGLWRVLRPGGLLFCRLASSIGMAERRFHGVAAVFCCLMARSDTLWTSHCCWT